MNRQIFALILLSTATSVFAQEPGGRGGRGGAPPPPPPLFFKETWKQAPGNVPVTQAFVVNPNLQLNLYGTGKEDFGVTSEGNVPHIWTGLCATSCALTLSDKENLVDLTGKAKIRWFTKTSGFHEVRPVLKLADGTWTPTPSTITKANSICPKCTGSNSICPKCRPREPCWIRWI